MTRRWRALWSACAASSVLLWGDFVQAQESEAAPTETVEVDLSMIPDTLMFSIDEYNDIQSRQSGGDEVSSAGRSAIEDASLYLSTILYFGPMDWTIWINGVPVTPRQDFSSFQVTEISPDHVQLLVPLSAQGMRPVRLAPNQTFITKSGIVVEGQVK